MFSIHNLFMQKRYVTREKATVVDVRDPSKSGKIKVTCYTLGDSNWIPYVMAPGHFTPPKVGDIVYLECEEGHESYPIAHGKVPNPTADIASGSLDNLYREVPTVAGWFSNGAIKRDGTASISANTAGFTGHAILLDDGHQLYDHEPGQYTYAGMKMFSYGGSKIILSDEPNAQKIIIGDLNNKSTPLLLDESSGNVIVIDSETDTITIQDNSGNFVSLANDSIIVNGVTKKVEIMSTISVNITAPECTIQTTGDTNILQSGGDCNITASGDTTVTATNINLNGSAGHVVTSLTDPIDLIFGLPQQGLVNVKAGN